MYDATPMQQGGWEDFFDYSHPELTNGIFAVTNGKADEQGGAKPSRPPMDSQN